MLSDTDIPGSAQRTLMLREALETPEVVARQLAGNAPRIARLVADLRASPPRAVVTCARGSSDCAATYLRYLVETRVGVLTSSLGLSVSSVYERAPDMAGTLFIAISQSGRSPDLLAATTAAKAAGARTVAMVNDETSPLAQLADCVLPLHAGPEIAVAATKSLIAALACALQLVTQWSADATLEPALASLPADLAEAARADWSAALPALDSVGSVYTLARGPGLAIAQEAALKLKETCRIHAEAFSAAEVLHGPLALAGPTLGVLAFGQDDETRASVEQAAQAFASRGSPVLGAGVPQGPTIALPTLTRPAHPLVEPLLAIQSFYTLAAHLSVARGLNPDAPDHLRKVTESL